MLSSKSRLARSAVSDVSGNGPKLTAPSGPDPHRPLPGHSVHRDRLQTHHGVRELISHHMRETVSADRRFKPPQTHRLKLAS